MRISTNSITQQGLEAMLRQQTELAKTQLQVSSGKRIQTPSDDPIGAVKMLDLQRQIGLSQQYQDNADVADSRLSTTDGALKSAGDIMQRIRELAVQALNDTNSNESRQGIAEEITQLNQTLVALANTTDSNGEYLFSGYQSDVQPFDTTTFAYNGDGGQRQLRVSDGYLVAINEPGDDLFITQTVAGPNQAIFQTIQDFTDSLTNGTVGTAPNDGDFLANMDYAMDASLDARTRIGTRQNAVEQQREINDSSQFSMTTTLSQIEDLDYAEAITQLNLKSVGLQAAQQVYVKVQGLSLFNFL